MTLPFLIPRQRQQHDGQLLLSPRTSEALAPTIQLV
jgi:hypothetical protein